MASCLLQLVQSERGDSRWASLTTRKVAMAMDDALQELHPRRCPAVGPAGRSRRHGMHHLDAQRRPFYGEETPLLAVLDARVSGPDLPRPFPASPWPPFSVSPIVPKVFGL